MKAQIVEINDINKRLRKTADEKTTLLLLLASRTPSRYWTLYHQVRLFNEEITDALLQVWWKKASPNPFLQCTKCTKNISNSIKLFCKKNADTNVWLKWNRYNSGQVIRGQWPQVDVEEMLTIHMPASSCLGIRSNNKFTASLALDLSYTSCNSAFTGRAKYYNTLSPGQFYFIKSWHNSNKGERRPWHRTLGIRIIKIQNIGV